MFYTYHLCIMQIFIHDICRLSEVTQFSLPHCFQPNLHPASAPWIMQPAWCVHVYLEGKCPFETHGSPMETIRKKRIELWHCELRVATRSWQYLLGAPILEGGSVFRKSRSHGLSILRYFKYYFMHLKLKFAMYFHVFCILTLKNRRFHVHFEFAMAVRL